MRARFRPGGDFFVLFAAATELQEVSTTDVNSWPSQLPSVGPTSFILRTRELRSVEVTEAGWQLGRE